MDVHDVLRDDVDGEQVEVFPGNKLEWMHINGINVASGGSLLSVVMLMN